MENLEFIVHGSIKTLSKEVAIDSLDLLFKSKLKNDCKINLYSVKVNQMECFYLGGK